MRFSRKIFGVIGLIVLVGLVFGWVWQLNPISIATGEIPLIVEEPYYQLSYVKLSPDHGGNFTGDAYVVDLEQNESFQLTKGGTTANVGWSDNEQMLISYRPKGSVVDLYYLDVNTAKLTPAATEAQNLFFGNDLSEPTFSTNGEYYAIRPPITENAQSSEVNILRAMGEGAEPIIKISGGGYPFPVWVPDSSMLVYSNSIDNFCLLNVENLEEVCRPGMFPAVSHSVQPKLIAFVAKSGGTFELCTAEIEAVTFTNVQCHAQNDQQITSLAWRP